MYSDACQPRQVNGGHVAERGLALNPTPDLDYAPLTPAELDRDPHVTPRDTAKCRRRASGRDARVEGVGGRRQVKTVVVLARCQVKETNIMSHGTPR